MDAKKYSTIDEYHDNFPPKVRKLLDEMRKIIRQAAPEAKEVISYNMPGFKQHGVLVYYAANKEHIGFYPTGSPVAVFKDELKDYKTSKGAIQFPMDQSLPKILIKKIVVYRMVEDEEHAKTKALKKKKK